MGEANSTQTEIPKYHFVQHIGIGLWSLPRWIRWATRIYAVPPSVQENFATVSMHNLPPPTRVIELSSKISCRRELKSKTWRSKFRSSSHDADLRMRKLGTTAARINRHQMSCQGAIMINFALLIFPLHTLAWNIPGHMLSGAIALTRQ